MIHFVHKIRRSDQLYPPAFCQEKLIETLQWIDGRDGLATWDFIDEEVANGFQSNDIKVALTFDDGYACQYECYQEVSDVVEVPSIFFVSQAGLRQEVMLVNRVQFVMAALAQVDRSKSEVYAEFVYLLTEKYRFLHKEDFCRRVDELENRTFDDKTTLIMKRCLQAWLQEAEALVLLGDLKASFVDDQAQELIESRLKNLYFDTEACEQLIEKGARIGHHTLSHPHLPELTADEMEKEVKMPPQSYVDRYFAYPYGTWCQNSRAAIIGADYEAGFGVTPAICDPQSDRFCLPRFDINHYKTVKRLFE